jgi:hypothetical protein
VTAAAPCAEKLETHCARLPPSSATATETDDTFAVNPNRRSVVSTAGRFPKPPLDEPQKIVEVALAFLEVRFDPLKVREVWTIIRMDEGVFG